MARPFRVVLIASDPEARAEMRTHLDQGSNRQYQFIEADTGSAGIAAVRFPDGGWPDCVLLDFDLPDMQAPEVLAHLGRAGAPPCPIVVLIRADRIELGQTALQAGAIDYIGEDWMSRAALTRVVENAVERFAMKRQLRRIADREDFFHNLCEAWQREVDPSTVKAATAHALVNHLDATFVRFGEIGEDGHLMWEHTANDAQVIDPCLAAAHAISASLQVLRAGGAVVIADVANDAALRIEEKRAPAATKPGAVVAVPIGQDHSTTFVLGVFDAAPRAWTNEEVALMQEAGVRALAAFVQARAEQRLRASEHRLRLALAAGGMGVWHWDQATGQSEVDATLQALSGLAPPNSGESWVALLRARIHPDDLPTLEADVERALREGVSYAHEFRYLHPDGRTLWLGGYGAAFANEGVAGNIQLTGVNFDITARRRAQDALAESRRDLQSLADNAPVILARFDRELRHVFVNATVEAMTGRPPSDFIGRTNREIGMPPARCDQWDAEMKAVFNDGQPRRMKFQINGPDGTHFFINRLVPEFGGDGRVAHVLAVTHDATEEMRSQATLREADRNRNEFLATLSHELRNPLAPISTGIALLRAQSLAPKATRVVNIMERQLARLVDLVNDLSDVSRVSFGKVHLRLEHLRLSDVVDAAVEACQPSIESRQHALSLDLPYENIYVHADRTRLIQVVANLLTNAVKYSEPASAIQIEIARESNSAVVRVRDHGIGIPSEALNKVWDMFSQIRESVDKSQGGLGIGLSLAKRLVELHGGSVAAESAGFGQGSVFTVKLPLAMAPAILEQPASGEPSPAASPRSRRVLIVDGNVDAAETLSALIAAFGHEAAVACDGASAIASAADLRPDLVFLDLGLPDMTGFEVARRLRGDPRHRHLQLIALSGHGTDEYRRMTTAAGFDLHVVKPVELTSLIAILDKDADLSRTQ
ncbi:response regulator [Variovorax sp. J22R133]|uniref:response regulator n=1 Tax=Variovorax brevis TaxID=3053503 RepID=UPI002576A2CC|nr:response regulator [Variovorax sp. J22R133]MDM0116964.1 response regulator [Variovorax sp. J22R133]